MPRTRPGAVVACSRCAYVPRAPSPGVEASPPLNAAPGAALAAPPPGERASCPRAGRAGGEGAPGGEGGPGGEGAGRPGGVRRVVTPAARCSPPRPFPKLVLRPRPRSRAPPQVPQLGFRLRSRAGALPQTPGWGSASGPAVGLRPRPRAGAPPQVPETGAPARIPQSGYRLRPRSRASPQAPNRASPFPAASVCGSAAWWGSASSPRGPGAEPLVSGRGGRGKPDAPWGALSTELDRTLGLWGSSHIPAPSRQFTHAGRRGAALRTDHGGAGAEARRLGAAGVPYAWRKQKGSSSSPDRRHTARPSRCGPAPGAYG